MAAEYIGLSNTLPHSARQISSAEYLDNTGINRLLFGIRLVYHRGSLLLTGLAVTLRGKHELHLGADLPIIREVRPYHVVVPADLHVHRQPAELKEFTDTAT